MCVVSNMGDIGKGMWPQPWGPINPLPTPGPVMPMPYTWPPPPAPKPYDGPTREQFEEFLELMRAARKFDIATGQKDCPAKDKISWLRELAEHLGLDPSKVDEVLK